MRGTGKFLAALSMSTALMVFYVHVQVSLFQVSYAIHTLSRDAAAKMETYRLLKFEVDQMKAPGLLEEKMKSLQMDLTLPQEIRVVQIPSAPVSEEQVLRKISLPSFSDGLTQVFGHWVKVAQAKTEG